MSQLIKIVPPLRFGFVEVGVCRGAYPTMRNFPFLKTLSLRTIISMIPEPPTPDLEDFCAVKQQSQQIA
jgi:tyrosine-protein phosphatase OCA6